MLDRWLWSACLVLCQAFVVAPAAAVPAPALPVHADAQFQFELGSAPFAGLGFAVDFGAPDPGGPGSFVEGGTAWGFRDLAAAFAIDGVPRDDTLTQVAWFAYAGGPAGVDLRFADVFEAGDWMQLVLYTRGPVFDGTVDAPTLRAVERHGLGGFVGYQNADGDYLDGALVSGSYLAGTVPEPAAAWMLAAGLGLMAWHRRR